jgi:hypothetical protein
MRSNAAARPLVAIAAGALCGTLGVLACGPPPIGWQGAGRLQTLPAPQSESGPMPTGDTGDDAGDDSAPGPDPLPPPAELEGGSDGGDAG